MCLSSEVNPFVPCFQGLEKGCIGSEWIKTKLFWWVNKKRSEDSAVVTPAMVPKGTTNEYSGANLTPQNRKLIFEFRFPKTPFDGKQNFTVNDINSWSEISDSRKTSTINHYESAGESGIASVVNGL